MKSSRAFISVDSSQLCPPDRQVTIGSELVLVHQAVERAVHRLDLIGFVFNIHLIKHIRSVEIKVTRCLPQVQIGNVRGVYNVVSAIFMSILPKVFDHLSDFGTLWMPEHQTTTSIFLDREKIKLLSQHAVITLLGLLQKLLVLLQLVRFLPSCRINALQHFAVFVPAPVSSCNTLKLYRLSGNLVCAFDMWSSTQIPPLVADVVNCDGFLQSLQDLHFERLIDFLDPPFSFFTGDLLTGDWITLGNDLVHLLFDLLQIGITQFARFDLVACVGIRRLWKVEIIVEPVVNPWPDGNLGLRENLLNGHGHYMGRRVPDSKKVVVFVGRQFDDFVNCLRLGSYRRHPSCHHRLGSLKSCIGKDR
mmetsp:Transcript_106664/g.308618  ORF Transcript_106664/g.308618 Transcript_106664/m.308618 type:complete len:362 (+) Transcript_106664:328-1413(+)